MTQTVVVAAVTVAACACVGVLGMLTYMVANNNNRPSRRDDDDHDEKEPVQRSRSRRVSTNARRGSVAAPSPASPQRNDRWLKSQLKEISHKQDFEMGVQGYASMEDVITRNADVAMQLEQLEPREVLKRIQEGNARFWMGLAERPEMSAMERRALIMQQTPKVAILGCSDSRVPIEIVFDQGLGDVFAIRVAGNVYGHNTAASIDYAVAHLKVKLIVILGHEGCGAVKAATLPDELINKEESHLRDMLLEVKQGLSQHGSLGRIRDTRAKDREAVVTNVYNQMAKLGTNEMITDLVSKGELLVVGAFYEISSGQVDFFEWETMIDSLEGAGSDLSPRNSPQLSPKMKKSLTTPKK